MRTGAMILFACATLSLVGCGGGQQTLQSTATGDVPSWFSTPPQDPNFLFGVGTDVSRDLNMAVQKAELSARADIARQLQLKVSGLQKSFSEETGTADNAQLLQQFTTATKTVVNSDLQGTSVKERKQLRDGANFRVYALMQYPIGEANAALVKAIRNNAELYTRFRASQSFEELDKEVQKYEEAKKAQTK